MDLARHTAMDAQRYDPLRRKRSNPSSNTDTSKLTMGQGLFVISQSDLSAYPVRDTVGGIWQDHEVVVVPISTEFNDSSSFTSTSTSSTTSSRAPTDTSASSLSTHPSHSRQAHNDIVITRTIIQPPRASVSRVSSPPPSTFSSHTPPPSRVSSPFSSRHTRPVLQALNCFNVSSAFESDLDDVDTEANARPILHVTVTQTREQYEDAMALKELVEAVYPAAAARRT